MHWDVVTVLLPEGPRCGTRACRGWGLPATEYAHAQAPDAVYVSLMQSRCIVLWPGRGTQWNCGPRRNRPAVAVVISSLCYMQEFKLANNVMFRQSSRARLQNPHGCSTPPQGEDARRAAALGSLVYVAWRTGSSTGPYRYGFLS